MKRLIEALLFVGLALGLHVLVAMRGPDDGGTEAAGAGGEAMVSLAAASASVETMVDSWDAPRPPIQSSVTPTVAPPVPQQVPLALPRLDLPPQPALTGVALPPGPPAEQSPPEFDRSTPKPVEPEPTLETSAIADQSSPRPMRRPDDLAQRQRRDSQLEPKSQQPAKTESTASAAVRKQRAAGAGGSPQAGAAGSAQVKSLGAAREAQLMSVWGGQIRARIESKKRFPKGARGNGRVVVRISVTTAGRITGARIAKASSNPLYNQEAIAAVSRADRVPRAPKELTGSSYDFNLPMDFSR